MKAANHVDVDGVLLGQLMVQMHLANAAVCECEYYSHEDDRVQVDLVERDFLLPDEDQAHLKKKFETQFLHYNEIPDSVWRVAWSEYCSYFAIENKYPICYLCSEDKLPADKFNQKTHHICNRCFLRMSYLGRAIALKNLIE